MIAAIALSIILNASGSEAPVVPKVGDGEYAVYDGTQYKVFKVFEHEGLKLSADCKAAKIKCKAYEATRKSVDKKQTPVANSSPASTICLQLGGSNLIAFNSKKEEYNYCQFDDGSMVNSWSLFYHYFPKNIVK